MNWITDKVLPKFKALVKKESSEEVLWIKCKSCEQMIFHKEHDSNLNVCKSCGYHDLMKIENRIKLLLDEETIENIQVNKIEDDPLDFKDLKKYSDRLKIDSEAGIQDEVIENNIEENINDDDGDEEDLEIIDDDLDTKDDFSIEIDDVADNNIEDEK